MRWAHLACGDRRLVLFGWRQPKTMTCRDPLCEHYLEQVPVAAVADTPPAYR